MLRPALLLAVLSAGIFPYPASAKPPAVPLELLYVGPLDTTVVKTDSTVDASALGSARTLRKAPSPAALIAQAFYPAFGAAVSLAARKVEAVDSSAALRVTTTDSARYTLTLTLLSLSQSSINVPRRYNPPTAPAYDPATGTMNPGNRKGYAEGPGRVTTLTARAQWILWDNLAQKPAARGAASGASSFRGDPGRSQWEEAARELAKDVLRQTAFSPF